MTGEPKKEEPTPITSVIEKSVGLEEEAIREIIQEYREMWLDQDEERILEIVEQMQGELLEAVIHEHIEPRTDDLQENADATRASIAKLTEELKALEYRTICDKR